MFSEAKNLERLPELVDQIRSTTTPACMGALLLNLRLADGSLSVTDIESVALSQGLSPTTTIHNKVISYANRVCEELGIQPPLLAQDKSKRRIVTVTGNMVRYALESSLENEDLVDAVTLEHYILTGLIDEPTDFSIGVCRAVTSYLYERVHDTTDKFKLDPSAIGRMQFIDSELFNGLTVHVAPADTSGEPSKTHAEHRIATQPNAVIEEISSQHPQFADIFKKIYGYLAGEIENLDEYDWAVIETVKGAFGDYILSLAELTIDEMGFKAKLEVLADAAGVTIPRKPKSVKLPGGTPKTRRYSR